MSDHSEHIVSSKLYFLIFFALIVGTVVTALVARVDLGTYHGIDANCCRWIALLNDLSCLSMCQEEIAHKLTNCLHLLSECCAIW